VAHEDAAERTRRLLRYSRLGALGRMTFDTLVPSGRATEPDAQQRYGEAVAAARRWADDPQGWLVLTGPAGSGKTHIAAAIAGQAIAAGRPALFLSVADLLDELRASLRRPEAEEDAGDGYDRTAEQLRNAPLLVLDDLDSFHDTPWAREKFIQLLSHRFHALLPTICTVDRSPEELDPRLASRLTDPEISQVLTLVRRGSPRFFAVGAMTRERMAPFSFERFRPAGHGLRGAARQNLEGAFRLTRGWAEEPDGWLVLLGGNGCGKTHLAAAIANYRLEQGDTACFANVPDLLDELRRSYGPDAGERFDAVFTRLREVPLLVLDDLGAHHSSPWAQEKLYQILNHRHLGRLPTVVTSNAEIEDIERRVRSRLADINVSTVFEITAPDYRVGEVQVAPPRAARAGDGRSGDERSESRPRRGSR